MPKVLGDLLTTLERTKRAKRKTREGKDDWNTAASEPVVLPMSGLSFFVPENLYVIATMNTTDRSVSPLDVALRRRFAYVRVEPLGGDELLVALEKIAPTADYTGLRTQLDIAAGLAEALNAAIGVHPELGPDAKIGHSYIFDVVDRYVGEQPTEKEAKKACVQMWQYAMFPQIFETLRAFGRGDLFDPESRQTSTKFDKDVHSAIKAVNVDAKPFKFEYVAGMMESLTISHPLTRRE